MKPLKMNIIFSLTTLMVLMPLSCSTSNNPSDPKDDEEVIETPITFYYGADLSYVNEMEDCGATYLDANNITKDPYIIFKEAGTNLVRVRLWHNSTWTNYSNYNDVKKTIQRAKAQGMKVLLDFHYSDTWTDPSKQEIPSAWLYAIDDTEVLGNLLYDYTYETLNKLSASNLLPDMVQVGNEINPMILQQSELVWPIDWARNASLINKGIKAVRDISEAKNKPIGVMLHIAQPENAIWWFEQATQNGVTDYDWIGLSYYPIWSTYKLNNVGVAFSSLINTYNKRLMVVETAYPFTLTNADSANNILNDSALIGGYPATQEGQLNYLNQLKTVVKNAGGEGVIYWEPAWVSTGCSTLWGQGSHWDNATLFDHDNKVTLGMQFYKGSLTN
jgi:arabinogalactan endo-1,4-beta-galactosidase